MDRLNEALEHHAAEMETGLRVARAEREVLRARERELTDLIERAEATLGLNAPSDRLTQYEAMAVVLNDGNNEWMLAGDIAAEINRRRLYDKRDGTPVESNQIRATAVNYSYVFERNQQQLIRLRTGDQQDSGPVPLPLSKYDGLRDFLLAADEATVTITFDEVADLVGSLPKTALIKPTWWGNDSPGSHVQTRSWLAAGFRVMKVNQQEGWVRFERHEADDGTVVPDGDAPST